MDFVTDLFRRFSPRDHRNDKPQSVSSPNPQNTHIHNPSVQGATQGSAPAYSLQGGPSRQGIAPAPHWDSQPRREGDFPGGFRQPGNFNSPRSNHPISQTNGFSQYTPPASPTSARQTEARDWFIAIDQDDNGELSYEELHHALLTNDSRPFSATTVKYLMGIFDRDGNGVITFDDFEPLWNYLKDGQQIFDSYDTDHDGRIGTPELGHALAHFGIHLAPYIVDRIMKKYDKAPSRIWQARHGGVPGVPAQMDQDHFVFVCAVVRRICDLYEEYIAGGQTRLSRDDFLRATIPLP